MKKASGFTKRMVAIFLSSMLAVGTIPGNALGAEVQENAVQEEEAITTYTVTLDANGGYFVNEWDDVIGDYIESTEILNKQIPVGGTVSTFPAFETDDQHIQAMTFSGWSLERDGEPVSQGDEEYTPVDNCVLYAMWEPEVILDNGDETDMQESEESEGVPEDDSLVEQEDTEDNPDDTENMRDTENLVDETEDDFLEEQEDTEDKSDDTENIGDTEEFSNDSADTEKMNPENANREAKSADIIEDGKDDSVRTEAVNSVVASGKCGENLTWALDGEGTMTISGTGEMDDYGHLKEGTYSGITSPGVAPWYYDYRQSIRKIVINEGVTSIGIGAFTHVGYDSFGNGYCKFDTITLPSTLTRIGSAAFAYSGCSKIDFSNHEIEFESNWGMGAMAYSSFEEIVWGSSDLSVGMFKGSNLKRIVLNKSITSIPNYAFQRANNLEEILIPNSVRSVGTYAFDSCKSLKSIEIPSSVESIADYSFNECSGLESVALPEGVKSIGEGVFSDCTSLKTVSFPESLKEINYRTCNNCESLVSVIFGEGIEVLKSKSFCGCKKLSSITLPSTLTTIEESVFINCNGLTEIRIPANVTSIETKYEYKNNIYPSFAGSVNLASISVDENNQTYSSFDGCLYDKPRTKLLYCPEGKTRLIIAPDTTSISYYALLCGTDEPISSNIKEIDFSTYAPTIEENSFRDLTATAYYNNFLNNWPSDKRQNYGGTITWVEKAIDLSECIISFSPTSYTYDGTAKIPTATLTFSGKTLTNNTDYTVSYTNNTNAGTATVTATGKGYFSGTISKNFIINKASPTLSFASSSISKTTSDSAFTNTLTKKTDGIVTFSSSNTSVAIVNSSTGQVIIKGAGSATITANAAAGTNYNVGSASYTLTVAQASKTFMVTYDANGGTGTPSPQVKQENVSLTLSSYEPTKYYVIYYNSNGGSVSPSSKNISCIFKNWNTQKNGGGSSYVPGSSYNANTDATLFAQWDNPFAGELATPTRKGYVFKGWYTSASGGTQVNESTLITSNVTIYAHWGNPYNIGDETYSFRNYGDSDSPGGHCFGMSMTSAGYYNDMLNIGRIGGDKNTPLYSFTSSSIVKEPICYYQRVQGSYSRQSIVAGGSKYLNDRFDIESDWQAVLNYVKNHKYDNTGLLQIGYRSYTGGHAINFLRYENVSGQDRIYVYDNNFPNQETYLYKDSYGRVLQAPVQTFSSEILCVALRDIRKYFANVGDFDATHVLYMEKDAAVVQGFSYSYIDTDFSDIDYVMYEIPADLDKVTIIPNKDYADFVYLDTEFSFSEITDSTRGELRFSSQDDHAGGSDTSFIIYEENVANPTVTLSKTSFVYNGSVQKPEVTVKAGSAVLKESNDYSVEYPSGMINAGVYKVKVTLKEKYSGVLFASFNIKKASQSLTLKTTASSIAVGKTASVSTTGNKGKVTYTSSNTAIATVNASTGVVTGKKAGTVTITASAAATDNYNAASKTVKITVTAGKSLKKPGNCHFAKWNNSKYTSCQIAWNKVAGAEGYQTLLSWTNGTHASSTITKSNVLYRNCTVHPQHVSQMKVRAFYTEGGKRVFGPWSNIEYITPSPAKLTAKNAGSGSNLKMNISWNIIYGCNGYNVFITTNPNGTWYWNQSTSTNATATSAVITKYRGSGLKKNTRYYVRIVTRRKRNGVFCTVPMPAKNTYVGSFIIK